MVRRYPRSAGALCLLGAVGLAFVVERRSSASSIKVPPGTVTVRVPGLAFPLLVLPTVYSPGEDSLQLASAIPSCKGLDVLDIGTGSGIQALVALERGARRVVATDINRAAVDAVRLNARSQGWEDRLNARLVEGAAHGAYAPLHRGERFDLVLCNPPFFDSTGDKAWIIAGDPEHALLRSLLAGLREHLKPAGRMRIVFWGPRGIELLESIAAGERLRLQSISKSPDIVPSPELVGMSGGELDSARSWLEVVEITPFEAGPRPP